MQSPSLAAGTGVLQSHASAADSDIYLDTIDEILSQHSNQKSQPHVPSQADPSTLPSPALTTASADAKHHQTQTDSSVVSHPLISARQADAADIIDLVGPSELALGQSSQPKAGPPQIPEVCLPARLSGLKEDRRASPYAGTCNRYIAAISPVSCRRLCCSLLMCVTQACRACSCPGLVHIHQAAACCRAHTVIDCRNSYQHSLCCTHLCNTLCCLCNCLSSNHAVNAVAGRQALAVRLLPLPRLGLKASMSRYQTPR